MKNVFKDDKGQDWEIKITINTIKRVKELCGVDLMELLAPEKKEGGADLMALHNDIELLINVLYAACKPTADARNISDVDFGELLASGQILDDAVTALLEGMMLFFPPRKSQMVRQMYNKYIETEEKVAQRTEEEVKNLKTDEILDEAFAQVKSGKPLTDLSL